MRVASVDIGTNSTRLLIASGSETGLGEIERRALVTALGRRVEGSGRLAADSIARTVSALAEYGASIRAAGVGSARAVATSASRDANNREAFFDTAQNALGFRPELISGEEEASLSFAGASLGAANPADTVVIDTGGGSTEFVADDGGVSIDIGSVRLTERCLPHHPAAPAELDAARTEAARVIACGELPFRSSAVGVAGTWTSLATMHRRLDAYDPDLVEGTTMRLDDVRQLVRWLATLTLEEKQAIPSLDPNRAPVILGGAVVAEASLEALALDHVTISEHDILDGVCLELLNDYE